MSSRPSASSWSRGGRDHDSHAYYSAASSYPSAQRHGPASIQRWREQHFVQDSQESDEASETEQYPERQTEVESYLPQEILDDHFDFATTRSILDDHQFNSQSALDGISHCVLSCSQGPADQPISQHRVATQFSDPTGNEPRSQQHYIVRSPSTSSTSSESQESQSSGTASGDQQDFERHHRETVATIPVSQPIVLSTRATLRLLFNTVGHLARDSSCISMDDGATQQATLPPTDPYAQKVTLGDFDRTDILCILIPTTPAAYQAVELVAESAPQHILRCLGKLSQPEASKQADEMVVDHDVQTQPKPKPSMDIALRMNSRVLNPALGFTFGRNKAVSDLLISHDKRKQISQRHFRIYVNSKGTLMCQDTSTNGTTVDSILLRPKQGPTVWGDQRTLHNGSVIEILINYQHEETMRFIVQVPDRSGVSQLYGSKLDQYIDFVEQMERRLQEENARKTQGILTDLTPAPVPQFSHTLHGDMISARANRVLVAATEPFNQGMQWNGGDTYHVTALLGKGAFASVYKLVRRVDGEVFAAKEIRTTVFAQRGVVDRRVDQELNIMKQLQHPNIVQYIDHKKTDDYLYILMELVPHGDLQSVLQTCHVLSEFECQAIASQMCEALKYLHGRDITHRDIKPDNILIQSNQPLVFKLSDFGLSKVVKNNETFLTSFCGTYLYCAPEVYPGYHHYNGSNAKPEPKRRSTKDGRRSKPKAKQPYTTAVDTWSIAAVLYHLLCGYPPFTGTTDNYGAVILENIMRNPVNYGRLRQQGVTQAAIDFVSRMLVIEPSERMSDVECLEHAWLRPEKNPSDSADLEFLTQVAARNDGFSTRDTERADDDGNLFEFQQLASQMSIKNHAKGLDSEDFEEPPSEDLAEIEEMVKGAGQDQPISEGEPDLDSFDEFVDQYPSTSQILHARQAAANNNNHLFGQISPAALRSSGALGREARRALEMSSHARGELDVDESHYEGSSQISATDYPNLQDQPGPVPSRHFDSGEAAPSLLGAEAMVDNLHMDSTMADVSDVDKQTAVPAVEGSNEQTSQSALDTSQSGRSDDYLYRATPPRSRRHLDEPSASMRESKRVKTQHETVTAREVESPMESADARATQIRNEEQAAATETASQDRNTTDTAGGIPPSEISGQQGLVPPQPTSTPSSSTTKADSSHAPTTMMAPITVTQPTNAKPSEPSKPPAKAAKPAEFAPPPGPITYGTLTPTSSSLPFKSIKLKQRVTTFGRHPACDYTWRNGLDIRVPKFALDIAFWRPRIERSLAKHPDLKWQSDKDLLTIIATRTSSAIFINGVALTKKPEGEKGLRYGVLRTGDVVMVFDDKAKGEKGEKLEFRVDIRIGRSKVERKEGEVFEVVKEEQEQQDDGRVGSSHGSVVAVEGQAVEGGRDVDEKEGDDGKQRNSNVSTSMSKPPAPATTESAGKRMTRPEG
ncbi:MAG: hypothetical protein Q9169_006248 [Polycauliona sp. 2 TL-2023]